MSRSEIATEGVSRRLARMLRVLVVALVISVAGLVWSVWENVKAGRPFNPLQPFATQAVTNLQRFVLPSDPYLRTHAVKCLAGDVDAPVKVHGIRQYQLLLPPGTTIDAGGATSVRYPAGVMPPKVNGFQPPTADRRGCLTLDYANLLPTAVLQRSAEVCRTTGLPGLWKLTGIEVPEAPDGRDGVARTWETEPFRVGCTG